MIFFAKIDNFLRVDFFIFSSIIRIDDLEFDKKRKFRHTFQLALFPDVGKFKVTRPKMENGENPPFSYFSHVLMYVGGKMEAKLNLAVLFDVWWSMITFSYQFNFSVIF